MARSSVTCYEDFCFNDNETEHSNSNLATYIVVAIALAVVFGAILFNNIPLTGDEILNNPYFFTE